MSAAIRAKAASMRGRASASGGEANFALAIECRI